MSRLHSRLDKIEADAAAGTGHTLLIAHLEPAGADLSGFPEDANAFNSEADLRTWQHTLPPNAIVVVYDGHNAPTSGR